MHLLFPRPPRHSILAAGTLLTAALLGWTACSSSSAHTTLTKSGSLRNAAPDFALKDSDGRVVHLSDYKGKVVVLDFWATWCGPCKVEIPWFQEFERQKKERGFAVLGVAMDDDGWESVKPFIKELNVNYRVVMGDDKTAQQYGGIEALPTTYLIDRDGRIAATHVGLTQRKDFENAIEQLLQDSQPRALRGGAHAQPAALRGSPGARPDAPVDSL